MQYSGWHQFFSPFAYIASFMVKFFLPSLSAYPVALTTPQSRKWVLPLFAMVIAAYIGLRLNEEVLTNLILPLFPDEPDKSFAFYRDFVRLCVNEGLWLSGFLLAGWIIVVYTELPGRLLTLPTKNSLRWLYASGCAVFVGAVLIAVFTLETFPNSADEYVYLYQAEMLSNGQLTGSAHPLKDFFHFAHIAQKDGVSVGRFPPGWPVLLSIPYLLNIPPWLLNPLLGIVTLWLFYHFCSRFYNANVAFWSTIVMGLTGYYLLNAASYFSHLACMLFTLGFVYFFYRHTEDRAVLHAWLAGTFLGAIVVTRYLNAVLIFVPFVAYLLHREKGSSLRTLFWMGLGGLPFVVFLGWYNFSITGDSFLPVTVWADPQERLGFVKGHTVMKALDHTLRRIFLFLYWASPAILILYFVYLFRKIKGRASRFAHPEDYYLLLLFAGYFFYHHPGGNQYGPRFLFEALPFATAFVVRTAYASRQRWAVALLAAGTLYAVVKLPYLLEREARVIEERKDVYEKVQAAGLSNAVVFIDTHTGVIRPMPVRDLTRNGIGSVVPSVIYAEDRDDHNIELMNFYPDRKFYRYIRPDKETPEGQLLTIP